MSVSKSRPNKESASSASVSMETELSLDLGATAQSVAAGNYSDDKGWCTSPCMFDKLIKMRMPTCLVVFK